MVQPKTFENLRNPKAEPQPRLSDVRQSVLEASWQLFRVPILSNLMQHEVCGWGDGDMTTHDTATSLGAVSEIVRRMEPRKKLTHSRGVSVLILPSALVVFKNMQEASQAGRARGSTENDLSEDGRP